MGFMYETLEEYDQAIEETADRISSIIQDGVDVSISAADTSSNRRFPSLAALEKRLRVLRRQRSQMYYGHTPGVVNLEANF